MSMRVQYSALNATPQAIRNGASLIRSLEVLQPNSAAPELYVQIFNTNSPTVGTTAPIMVLPVPAGNANVDNNSIDYNISCLFGGKYNSTGLSVACTTTPGGSTAPTAGQEPVVWVDYNQVGA